ncbi:Anucleate primary sterigmata protein A [Cytospora mali]|uniref:Anucleate primary sterigmata protein A n=1 Tax=Cytospora mali TaxID=578113 RepID=A0A194UZE3_CYTMA|nr:Anucleate primary sterigmata protein A [Valsa mali var. pyri (nom. inval.)]
MATSMASDEPSLVIGQEEPDPFVSSSNPTNHRFANFDSHNFALGPGASPASAKHALEAHLADTDRRMEEAGKLGTALVQQRKELEERLKEVEQLEAEEELSPDLKQKLMVIEKDYNEVARDSARAFLPKQRMSSYEVTGGMPFTPDKGSVRRSVSPSKFESLATGSPSKFGVPNRKMRNQPANRIHDIEFAAEISTSLITQVRNLQALLQEREEEVKDLKTEKSGLQVEVEGFQQRMRNLDESESRYKDENWNLETQIQELMAAQREASDREKKLTNALSLLQADKNSTQRELDEIKTAHTKLAEDHAAAVKHHDIELGTAKRNAVMAEGERAALQRKIEELANQNQELAKAISLERGRASQRNTPSGSSEDDLENAGGNMTPEHSPPPSPIKPTPRHSMLETETLKTSLQHAQRTIQSLRTNVHREKTEKLELKRLLQDARDELEKMRTDPVERPHHRRAREAKSREFKKPAKLDKLGTARAPKAEILHLEDPEWEEVATQKGSPPLRYSSRMADFPLPSTETDEFETANEANETTDTFETAHERGTETEDFQTGAENFSDSDTETESPSRRAGAMRANALKRAPIFAANHEYTYESTASTSASEDEGDYMDLTRTPGSPTQKRLRPGRGTLSRRSRQFSEGTSIQGSPASHPNSSFSGPSGMPQQSLFAELNELEGSDEDSITNTPGQRSIRSVTPGSTARGHTMSPASTVPAVPAMPKVIMVDSGMMTDPVDMFPVADAMSPETVVSPQRPMSLDTVVSAVRDRPLSTYSDASAQYDIDERLAQFPAPPAAPTSIGSIPTPFLPPPQRLGMSSVYAEEIQPRAEPEPEPALPPRLGLSDVVFEHIEPLAEPEVPPPTLSMSHVVAEGIEPVAEPEVPPPAPPALSVSSIVAEHVEPVAEPEKSLPPLAFSSISSTDVEPVAEPEPEPKIVRVVEYVEAPKPPPPTLALSSISSAEVEPVAEPKREPEILRVVEYVDAPKPPAPTLALSSISSAEIEPVAEPEREPRIVRVVEYMDAPKPPPVELSFSALVAEGIEPQAEPEVPLPLLSLSSIASEQVEPRVEPQPLPPSLSLSSVVIEDIEPKAEPQPPLSVSAIASEQVEPVFEPQKLPPSLSVSTIVSEQVEPVIPVETEVIPDKPKAAVLDFSTIQSLETPPIEPEYPTSGKLVLPPLGFSAIEALDTEPISPRSPKRNGFIIPRDEEEDPVTPSKGIFGSFFGRGKGKEPETPIIAEDETRQSPSDTPLAETPESQRPLKEISANTTAKDIRKENVQLSDSAAQTSLTAEAIDQMLHARRQPSARLAHQKSDSLASVNSMGSPGTVRIQRSLESISNAAKPRGKMVDTGLEATFEAASWRPGSAASTRASLKNAPPLPPNHKEVIEAARTGTANSGHGTIGSMGPPIYPASAYKNSMNRPRTPVHLSVNNSAKGSPTPRNDGVSSSHGMAELHSPNRLTARSRKSSVSSFASEVDARFNGIGGMGMGPHGFGPNTDPRMIQAITQTMIGEYLWKYTRKTGRGEMSENRHRRYFWVHPYTRTLYWSDRDPTTAGRSELRAKSVPIEAVRVVTDDNPMPPGLHRKSLIIISPGRSVKFTCTTGQRHETWFNALSYLLLRTNSEGQADTEELVNGITRDDVEEFNPSYGARQTPGTRSRAAPSISSYNSHGTRNHAMNLDVPTLTPNHKKATSAVSVQSRPGFSGRLSGYWKSTQESLSGLRTRSGVHDQTSLYENDEVHDSAEDLRQLYERQDREADRLDNHMSSEAGIETGIREPLQDWPLSKIPEDINGPNLSLDTEGLHLGVAGHLFFWRRNDKPT